jgi:peptidoglycan/LPS O-acetylase OafA/YrhL
MTAISIGEAVAGKRNNFHLIRLLAALLVIYGHCYPISGNPGHDLIQQTLQIRFAGSFATDTFFLISGFLITASVEKSTLYHYLWARFLRIFPALLVCVALMVFVLGPLVTVDPGYWNDPRVWSFWRNSSLLTAGAGGFAGVLEGAPRPVVNGSLWTLNVEVRLYLLMFVLACLRLLKGKRLDWWILAAIAIGYFYVPKFWPFGYLTSSDRWHIPIALFLIGSFIWRNRYSVPLSFPLLGLFLFVGALFHDTPKFEIAYFACLTYVVFFVAYVPVLPVIKYRDLSYGVYLYGWPVQQLVEHFRPDSTAMFNMVWSMLIALALAFVSWELLEKHALKFKGHVTTPRNDLARVWNWLSAPPWRRAPKSAPEDVAV